jgi:hypothetical protein
MRVKLFRASVMVAALAGYGLAGCSTSPTSPVSAQNLCDSANATLAVLVDTSLSAKGQADLQTVKPLIAAACPASGAVATVQDLEVTLLPQLVAILAEKL